MRVRRPDLPAEPVTWRRSTAVSDNHQPHPLLLHEIKRPATTRWWWHTTAIRARRGRREREEWRRKKETKREREIGATDRRSEPRTSGLRHYPTGLPFRFGFRSGSNPVDSVKPSRLGQQSVNSGQWVRPGVVRVQLRSGPVRSDLLVTEAVRVDSVNSAS
ncbi:hypothetical protein HanIR_Chr10g0472831 [Helianthus annuus]|uniref:uncharacterized protein LOC110885356 n=1 Tax=Helianthus annuus TaxID=4232 RepID=UPI000B8F2387|nr:uncharacterized protein LOC110885356 [Helianthus annuus]KAJ0521602.1 hypothetical protein HanIR_Chr10g0472831 [Helianthus annuus]